MPTNVLFSIKPNFAEAILAGRKTFELRRRIFRDDEVRKVVIYASSPVSRVVGEFEIDKVLALEPRALWSATSKGAGVDREFFDRYFSGRSIGFALKVSKPRRFKQPEKLRDYCGLRHPPQSFCYLD